MGWFFTQRQSENEVVDKNISVETLHRLQCRACPLSKSNRKDPVHSQGIDAAGTDNPVVYVLGESPGKKEDLMGEPFVGQSGGFLRSTLAQHFKQWADLTGEGITGVCRFSNVVRTHPTNNNNPSETAVECCRPSVVHDIERTRPRLILAVGGLALNWLLLSVHQAKLPYKIAEWRGRFFPVQVGSHRCWAAAVHHPAYILRMKRQFGTTDNDYTRLFNNDLTRISDFLLHSGPPEIWSDDGVEEAIRHFTLITGDVGDIERFDEAIEHFSTTERFAFDIETASSEELNDRKLRPYGRNSRILSISFSDGDWTVSVALDHPGSRWSTDEREHVMKALRRLFERTPDTVKVAHNLAFELEWMVAKLGLTRIHGCNYDDTMAQAYVLDPRAGVLSLDVLSRIWFGQRSKKYEPIDVIHLEKEQVDRVLRYNGVDSYFTHFLYTRQRESIIREGLEEVATAQAQRIPSFTYAQLLGIPISQEEARRHETYLSDRIKDTLSELQNTTAVREFTDRFGTFNPGSDSDVRKLLRDVMKRNEGYRGNDSSYSTEESVLKQIDQPVTQEILNYRQYAKLKSTYVYPLIAENERFVWPDGKVHPVYKLAFVATRRTSSEFPNIQNQPKRRDRQIRSCFVAPDGYLMVPIDYGQIEARVIAMASEDKYLVEALWNRYDIHKEWAIKMANTTSPELLGRMEGNSEEEKMDKLRQEAKNKLVFPAFYGAQAPSIAQSMDVPTYIVRRWLDEFWDTFSGVRKWQLDLDEFYREYGYVELLTRFRRYAPLEGNKIINTPIQGTASDIVVDAMNRCSMRAEETGNPQLQPRMNIHDDLTFFIKEDELEEHTAELVSIMLTPVFDFINVPLAVEITAGPDWYRQEDVAKVFSDEWFSDAER